MSTKYERGRRFERRVRDALRGMGFNVIRSAGSKTPVDLVALCSRATILVQCKANQDLFGRDERGSFVTWIENAAALGLVAFKAKRRGPIIWWAVMRDGEIRTIDEDVLLGLTDSAMFNYTWTVAETFVTGGQQTEGGTDGDDEGNIADRAV